MKKISDLQYRQIAEDIQAMYFSDVPPPDKVVVVRRSLHRDQEDPVYYNAVVRIGVDWCGSKNHAVILKFKWDNDKGLQDLQYLSHP